MPLVAEAFCDRGYEPGGRLVPRSHPGAVITDPEVAARRALAVTTEGRLPAVDGSMVTLRAATLCTHSDTPEAVVLLRRVRSSLEAAGVTVGPYVGSRVPRPR